VSEARIDRIEEDVHQIAERLRGIELTLARIEATLPQFATKAELTGLRSEMTTGFADLRVEIAKMPSKTFLATAIGVLLVAYAAGLAGLATLPVVAKLVQ
jgi:hypothetical protein